MLDSSTERIALLKSTLIACAALLLAACSTPAPETVVASVTQTPAPTLTPSPIPPTETPSPTPTPTPTPVPWRVIVSRRRSVICGIDPTRPDYARDAAHFDVDVCRALAAALFDDPDAVDARPLDRDAALAALESGEIDVYFGAPDAGNENLHNGPTLFVDATGAIARNDVGIRQIADMKFATVCLAQDSIDERLFEDAATALRVTFQPLLFNATDLEAMYQTYDQGRCDVVVDDRVRLAQRLPALSASREQSILDLALVKGQRALMTSSRDVNWAEIIDAVGNALIRAEEMGITSNNLEDALAGDDPAVRQFLGVEGAVGQRFRLSRDFAARIVKHVGNYGEMHARHYPNLPRGLNALARDGGMIATP